MSYKYFLDSDIQITIEELIAALIFDYNSKQFENMSESTAPMWPSEGECMDMGRRILALVLKEFRPDLIADDEWSFNEN